MISIGSNADEFVIVDDVSRWTVGIGASVCVQRKCAVSILGGQQTDVVRIESSVEEISLNKCSFYILKND